MPFWEGAVCMELDYFVVDVFTDTALAGNPLAVVRNICSLATELRISKMGLSNPDHRRSRMCAWRAAPFM
jgi:hypothetical protein